MVPIEPNFFYAFKHCRQLFFAEKFLWNGRDENTALSDIGSNFWTAKVFLTCFLEEEEFLCEIPQDEGNEYPSDEDMGKVSIFVACDV